MLQAEQPDARALVDALLGPSPHYKRQEVAAVLARREETTPYLLAILEAVLADPPGYLAQLGSDFDPLYVVALLAHLREPSAHELLLRLCRLPELQFEDLLGDFITEGMDRALFATCDGRTEGLRALAADTAAYIYLRSQAMYALAMAVHQGWAEREEVLAFLASLLVPEAAEAESSFWANVCAAMLSLHPVPYAEALLRAWDDGLIDPFVMSRRHIEEQLAKGPAAAAAELAQDVGRALTPDVHDWMGGWACFRQETYRPIPSGRRLVTSPDPQALRAARAAKKKARKRERSAKKKQRKKKK